jgi:hypothetical protein
VRVVADLDVAVDHCCLVVAFVGLLALLRQGLTHATARGRIRAADGKADSYE